MKSYITIIVLIIFLSTAMGCKKKHHAARVPAPGWEVVNTTAYPMSMTAVVQVPEGIRSYIQDKDEIAAFVGDECRGTGTWVHQGSVSAFFILIHGKASEQSKISFRYWNAYKSNIYTTAAFLDFTTDGTYGAADAPQILDLKVIMNP